MDNQPDQNNSPATPAQSSAPAPIVTPTPTPAPAAPVLAPAPVAGPTPASNQTTIMALVFFLVLLAVAVILLAFRSAPGGNAQGSYDPELEALRAQVQSKRLALGLSEGSDTSAGLTAESLTTRIAQDAGSLGDLLQEITNRLAAKDRIIEQKNNEIDNAARARESLTAEIGTLTRKLDEARLASTQNTTLLRDLESTKMLLETSNTQLRDLRDKLAQAPSDATLLSLREQLTAAQIKIDTLEDRLRNAISPDQLTDLRQENRKLKLQLQELRTELNRSRLFVEKAESLSPAAKALYARLTALEGHSNEERLQAYQQIKSELSARVVENVAFSTGSSAIDVEKVGVIQGTLEATSTRAEYLIVGYASLSGDAEINRELSSKRATTVATIADLARGDRQEVKAVFLGQTNRFSSTNDYSNQICEIWEVLPE